ncbi:Type II restriction/modification system, DNA methylase subunit YeeA [Salegentibacter echinorum]|uniref:site-specific DNA-methyltransferase (adenine-specific) n=1 Tax=Salegentibacter echinorum TaxID=1073325 RepID=A0A1M5EDC8_SALEC|nr:DNA methyltransferase [Salegentibacter echinorum]SHF77081.1 Type II restriction/modification system, DNA methylase subunit YeeA [Salegentibacter echinorum]
MKSAEIKNNVQDLIDNFSKEEFIFDLLRAYGISKTSVTRLKKGDYNLSKVDGEILYKKKIFFKVEATDRLLSSIDSISNNEQILKQKPRFAVLTDYKQLVARDLKLGKNLDIKLKELSNYFDFFLPLAGSEVYNATNNNEADRNASYKMAELYDLLVEENPNVYNSKESVHELNIFLSRLLFCFFAEDTDIFEQDSIFTNTLAQHTTENGKDTHTFLDELFDRLNSESGKDYPAFLAKFPYVNGGLFGQKIYSPKFNTKTRKILIDLGDLKWSEINPDIFGSMIQAVVDKDYRSDLGMHYTSVENIKKLIKPLFLDELYEAYENARTVKQLNALIQRISKIKFFDPACGSGNFLIITYKEIRLLEIKILQKITDLETNPSFKWTSIQLSQFYGIEIDDFAHEMAILSLWLAEHQMNKVFEEMLFDYGKTKPILPLKEAGQIQQGNATRKDWSKICPISKKDEVYIIGNPPYLGYSRQDESQKEDMKNVFSRINNYKKLDYIACWFYKATKYIENRFSKYAYVTTNSITQGEQVALLWPLILNKGQEIEFAHQSFKWTNNAKGNAGVAVVIIGIRNNDTTDKFLYNQNLKQSVKNISPYITNTSNVYVSPRTNPLSNLPSMIKGSSPGDNGNLLLDQDEKNEIISKYPEAEKFIKKYIGASEFIKGTSRYCIHITDENVKEAYKVKALEERFEKVEIFRLNSKKVATQKKAETPHFFDEDKHQKGEFILVPQTGSERRNYVPIGYFDESYVPSNATRVIYKVQPWLFGVISSRMHIVWVKAVAGRLKMDMQYSNTLCYNTFPFPDITTKQKENLNQYVFDILDERAKHPSKTMAQLYNPSTMPKGLLQAHQELDTAIEQCYRLQPFKNDTERLEYLFKLYEKMVKEDTLFSKQKKTRKKKVK